MNESINEEASALHDLHEQSNRAMDILLRAASMLSIKKPDYIQNRLPESTAQQYKNELEALSKNLDQLIERYKNNRDKHTSRPSDSAHYQQRAAIFAAIIEDTESTIIAPYQDIWSNIGYDISHASPQECAQTLNQINLDLNLVAMTLDRASDQLNVVAESRQLARFRAEKNTLTKSIKTFPKQGDGGKLRQHVNDLERRVNLFREDELQRVNMASSDLDDLEAYIALVLESAEARIANKSEDNPTKAAQSRAWLSLLNPPERRINEVTPNQKPTASEVETAIERWRRSVEAAVAWIAS